MDIEFSYYNLTLRELVEMGKDIQVGGGPASGAAGKSRRARLGCGPHPALQLP